jgi:hypothetical protein
MKKSILSLVLLTAVAIVIISFSTFAQISDYRDRLSGVRDLINSNELIMIWSEGMDQSNQFCYQRILDLDLTHPGGVDSTLIKKPLNIDSTITGHKKLAVATGNFLGGSFKHFVAAWEGEDTSITIVVPEIESGTLSWGNSNRLSLYGRTPFGTKIDVKTGDFYGNRQDEFVVGFQGPDSTIHIQLFSFDQGILIPQQQGSIHDEKIHFLGGDDWDIVVGDFNSDGFDDIALLFVKPLGSGNWSLYVKIYTVDENGNLLPQTSHEVFQKPAWAVTGIITDGAPGAFDTDASMEIAFAFCLNQETQTEPDTYVYLVDVRNNLSSIVSNDTRRITREELNESDLEPMNVEAGDLNKDYRDEVILMVGQTIYVYESDQLVPLFKSQQSVPTTGDYQNSNAFLAVEDMDLDRSSEIVVAKSYYDNSVGGMQHFELNVFSLDTLLTTFTVKARRTNESPVLTNTGIRNFAIALGDFDGDRTRLGDPVHFRRRGVMQPTVVLYTPPIHYDIFDNTSFDLSGCYPNQSCGFSSSYIQSTTSDTTITTEVHEDWGGDITVTLSEAVLKEKVKATYGDKFSQKESSGTSYTITTGRVAAGDDWLYSNVYDIDFYEYPVYDSLDSTPIGYFLVTIPSEARPLWIELKDDDLLGNQFRPDHETGNILSYRTSNTFDTSRVIVDFPEQTVGATGNSFVSLQMQSFEENNIESSWDAGLEIGASVDVSADIYGFEVGLEVEVNGHYNYGEIYTQTVKVQQSLEVRGDLGHLEPQFGTSGTYYVQPYSYWTSYGALALDYKVSQLPVGGNSFWQERYGGKSDLAFSLPWRYDSEKGFPLPGNDSTYRYRSRDVVLSKIDPKGGDSVMIAAKVRNFGLEDVTSPFTVSFYDGNPNTGGNFIAETTVDTIIAARGYRNVVVPWAIPLNQVFDDLRIYAVIDEQNTVTNEVHENNNMGWAPAIGYGSIVGVETEITVPENYVLYQSYPNPFNPATTIKYSIPKSSIVSLRVYDILGREVEVLLDEHKQAGSYSVQFNASRFASGVYFYRLQAGSFIETKKMILMK